MNAHWHTMYLKRVIAYKGVYAFFRKGVRKVVACLAVYNLVIESYACIWSV